MFSYRDHYQISLCLFSLHQNQKASMSKSLKMANFLSKPAHPPTLHKWSYGEGNTQPLVKIALWNVNGIRSIINKGIIYEFIQRENPHILCLNETKLDLKAFDKNPLQFQGYEGYWNFCKVSSGYSGVATFSKHKAISAHEDFECEHLGLQGRCLTLEFQNFFVVNCYKPNSGTRLQRLVERVEKYDEKFRQYVCELKKRKKVIIVGDMNVAHQEMDLKNPKANVKNAGFTQEERQSFGKLLQSGFYDSFRFLHPHKTQYTWWSFRTNARSKNIGWRIDYILSSCSESVKEASILEEYMGSDHCPIACTLSI